MGKVNFTKEHQDKLNSLSLAALQTGETFAGRAGTQLNIYDLYQTVQLPTLQDVYARLKTEVEKIEKMDEFSLTDYQIKKNKELKEKQELVNLMIGYKRWMSEKDANKELLRDLNKEMKELKESTKTPEEKLKELEARITEAQQNS